MANIIINHQIAGATAGNARSLLASDSWKRMPGTFYDSMGNKIDYPAKSDIVRVITEIAQREGAAGGFKVASGTKDYLEQWEKDYIVGKESGFVTDAKDSRERYGKDPQEWDLFELSFDQNASDAEKAAVRDIMIDVLQSPRNLGSVDSFGNTIPFKGMNGKRAVFVTESHKNTGHHHFHFMANRFAIDVAGNEASIGVDLSKPGKVATLEAEIRQRILDAGINLSVGFISTKSKAVTENTQALQAQANTQQQIAQAGGQAPGVSAPVGVTIPVAPGQTMVVAAPLTPDAVGMKQQSNALKSEAERKFREIERMQAEATAAAEAAAKLDQAIQALADNEVLRSTLEETQAKLEEATAKGESLEATNTDLNERLDAAEAARQIQHEALVDIGTNLGGKAMLGLDVEQAEDLARGNVVAIGAIVDSLGDQVGAWNEALDQLPEEMAEALREDPFKGLNDLVDELLEKRKLATDLTTERDGLQGKLTAANTLNTQLQGQLDAKAADLVDLQAKMAKREEEFASQMEEQVAKVRDAEAAVLRSEGTLQAKQQQLEAEQAKVKELTRTKEAIMDLMTSNDPHAAWEQSKDLFKDDVFANRAMGAFLRTASELEQAQQTVTKLKADVETLGQVKLDLEEAKATIEEHMGVVNDAGVADLRALGDEYKKTRAANATLEQQITDLTAAAQVDQAAAEEAQKELEAARQEASTAKQAVATVQQSAEALRAEQEKATAEAERLAQELEQAKAQLAQASVPTVAPEMQAALELLMANPELASLVQEAASSDALRDTLVELSNEVAGRPQGLQQVDRTQDGGEDYLGQSPDAKGPKKNDPDQGNNLG